MACSISSGRMLARRVQAVPLIATTEEVGVLAAVAPGRDAERQAVAALAAVDAAAQVVLANSRALASDPLLIEQRLHALERVRVDQGSWRPSKVCSSGAAPVDDLAGVVRVAEQALHDGLCRVAWAPVWRSAGSAGRAGLARRQAGRWSIRHWRTARNAKVMSGPRSGSMVTMATRRPSASFIDAVEVAEAEPAVGAADAGLLLEAAFDVLGLVCID